LRREESGERRRSNFFVKERKNEQTYKASLFFIFVFFSLRRRCRLSALSLCEKMDDDKDAFLASVDW